MFSQKDDSLIPNIHVYQGMELKRECTIIIFMSIIYDWISNSKTLLGHQLPSICTSADLNVPNGLKICRIPR